MAVTPTIDIKDMITYGYGGAKEATYGAMTEEPTATVLVITAVSPTL